MTSERYDVAIVGGGFSGSIMARVLAVLGYDVVLLERGTHPRFAIGESTTPLANLSLERLGARYGLADCYHMAAHGRWLEHHSAIRCGLKRGFTFYRHHPGKTVSDRGSDAERLLVAASPNDLVSDTHWLRADVDHHFVRQAVDTGVDYRDRTELTAARFEPDRVRLSGTREGEPLELDAAFVIDASGPGGFLARQLGIPSGLEQTQTRSGLVFSHFTGVGSVPGVVPGLPQGPYPDDWAAVHHLIDEGWMYSLQFDHGVTSAGFALTPQGVVRLGTTNDPAQLWAALLERYPTIGAVFANADPVMRSNSYRVSSTDSPRARRALGHAPHARSWTRCSRRASRGVSEHRRSRTRSRYASSRSVLNSAELDRRRWRRWKPTRSTLVAAAYEAMAHFDSCRPRDAVLRYRRSRR
jgi:FADH2 O2-dependent halogenase